MGYYVDVSVDAAIPAGRVAAALAAINSLHSPENASDMSGGTWSGGRRIQANYSWVTNPSLDGFPTLIEALREWRYDAHVEPNGDVVFDYFNGEKLGDDEVLWATLAPYLTSDSVVFFRGEDHCEWRYRFVDGKLVEDNANTVFHAPSNFSMIDNITVADFVNAIFDRRDINANFDVLDPGIGDAILAAMETAAVDALQKARGE